MFLYNREIVRNSENNSFIIVLYTSKHVYYEMLKNIEPRHITYLLMYA